MRGTSNIFEQRLRGMLNQRLDENDKGRQLLMRINKLTEKNASVKNTMHNLSRSFKASIEKCKDLQKEVEILKDEHSQPDLSFNHAGKLSRGVEDLTFTKY